MKYNFQERENWIKLFQPNYKNQKWHKEKVYHPNDIKHLKYFKLYKIYDDYINPKNIIGIKYGYGYNENKEIDWLYMLQNLRRLHRVIDNFKDKKSLIEHIHRNKDEKSVLKYGNYYFTTSGQHRLCIAKYLELEKVKVSVTEYRLDKELFIREKKVSKIYHKLFEYGLVGLREYEEEIKCNFLTLKLKDKYFSICKELVNPLLDKYENINSGIYKAIPNIIKSFFYPLENNTLITKESELYILDFHIVKHIRGKK
ncbi:hypothetical protein KRX57_09075 [Weeksellaceae bacterium TAE3-ERU29]|nr:hypothetical protein [Weeksellaceae bacterium TAE3-ERU29]